ncbi:M23 family metallopeptidase [Pyxidicoccus sp. 3LG]
MKNFFLVSAASGLMALASLAPSVGHAACDIDSAAQSAPGLTSGNWYHRIDGAGNVGTWHPDGYYQISSASMVNRGTWLDGTVARMPVYKPFRDTGVGVGVGWMYGANSRHNAVDYDKDGASFRVDAVADGTVVWVGYMSSPGNVVIVEHTARDGSRFRTVYHHLRDGRDEDIARARLTKSWYEKSQGAGTWASADSTWKFYQNQADADAQVLAGSPTAAQLTAIESRWGTPSQGILVSEGQTVKAGQQIGMAGLTGAHGMNSNVNNTHLHIMFARPAPHWVGGMQQNLWTLFDPYGLYALSPSCYQTEYPTGRGGQADQHASHFAPFFQDFAGVDSGKFQQGFDYFASFGWFPYTLATESSGWTWKMGGAFQYNASAPVTRTFRTFAVHQSDAELWDDYGWRPDKVVGMTAPDAPRFTAIYAPITTGYIARHKMTPSWFGTQISDNYNAAYLLTDASAYLEAGQLFFTGTWVKQPAVTAQYLYHSMTEAQLWDTDDTMKASGLKMVQVSKYSHPGLGDRYLALWHVTGKTLVPVLNLTPDQFRSYRDLYVGLFNYKIRHVSAYGGTYAVIFEK